MPDPVTWDVVGGWSALEGIKFLYGQAAEVLKAWRERRRHNGTAETQSAHFEVPILDNEVLDGAPAPLVAAAVMEKESAYLVRLLGALAPYAQGLADPDPDDRELAQQAGRLRAVLEAAYGQRFTLRGEQREPTGTHVMVDQVLGEVSGVATGVEAQLAPGSNVTIRQKAETIAPGGSITGFKEAPDPDY
jgi:hypothetical protein